MMILLKQICDMITVIELTENLQKYVDTQLAEMAKTNPMIGFTKPLISRAAYNVIDKAHSGLSLLADKEGKIDIDSILTEMSDSLVNTQTFTINTSFIGDIVIGNGSIKIAIPFTEKNLVLSSSDLQNLKEMLINK